MNPLVSGALQSIIRGLLWALAGYLVKKGLWTDSAASLYVEAASLAVVGFLWSVYQAWKNDQLVSYLEQTLHWHQRRTHEVADLPPAVVRVVSISPDGH